MVKNAWLSLSLAALVAVPTIASAGWVIEWRNTPLRKDVRQETTKARAYLGDNKSRMEQEHLTTINDYEKSKFTIINPESKYYWSGNVEEYVKLSAKRRREAMVKKLGGGKKEPAELLPELDEENLPEITVELSGETKELAGHQVTKYLVRVNEELFQEMWIAEALDLSGDIDPEKLVTFQQKSSRGMVGASAQPYNALYRSADYLNLLRKGFALETLTHHIAGGFEQSARSIRETTVDDESFSPPEGYRRVRLNEVFQIKED